MRRFARLPASRRVWIFDLDNTLHDASVHIFPSMHVQINDYLMRNFGLDQEGANELRRFFWERYGTTLKGLMRHYGTDPKEFLRETHQFPGLAGMMVHDNALHHALSRLAGRKVILSNAPRHYIEDVVRALGVARHFEAVYSIESTRFRPKPSTRAFQMVMRNHDLDPHRCAFIDDSLDNLRTAKNLGMSTIWIEPRPLRASFVDLRVGSVIDLPRLVFRHAN